MIALTQIPAPGECVLAVAGDVFEFHFKLSDIDMPGRAFLRTNIGCACVRRREIIAHTDEAKPFLAANWHDIEMTRVGENCFRVALPLVDTGYFLAKAFFLPDGTTTPIWPQGDNTAVKVAPSFSVCGNSIYTAFVRQFRDEPLAWNECNRDAEIKALTNDDYAVIPRSGTFRNLSRRLDHIIGTLGFRIIQLLPIHPVPTTYARMGRYGSPFASLNFYDVDPAFAEFDGRTTPLAQFCELVDAIHARGARVFIDLPANHTGWASAFQTNHPEWFKRNDDGTFKSPGAWGVIWADLVELDYSNPDLRAEMAQVFLFWCSHGVDGFRCDAGYMIPAETWEYIIARVRVAFPETVFMLEGLGGKLEVTDGLMRESNLDWAYSELFQERDRAAISHYLAGALPRSERFGPLVNFAETHDNNRLAAEGERYSSLRVALSAMLSQQGAFGITAGVEWYCRDKIDVHGAASLRWGAPDNQIQLISRLNSILDSHPAFAAGASVRLIQRGGGNVIAALRSYANGAVLVAANLDADSSNRVEWDASDFFAPSLIDLITGDHYELEQNSELVSVNLHHGAVVALTAESVSISSLTHGVTLCEPQLVERQRRNHLALFVLRRLTGEYTLGGRYADANAAGEAFSSDPVKFCSIDGGMPRCSEWTWPEDSRRVVMVPPGFMLNVRAPSSFRVSLRDESGVTLVSDSGVKLADGTFATLLPTPFVTEFRSVSLDIAVFCDGTVNHATSRVLLLPSADDAAFNLSVGGARVREGCDCAILANRRGAMAHVRSAWGTVKSQYDALLAINPHSSVPDNRYVFFTRCKAWVQNCGYSYELDASSTESFTVEPGGHAVSWRFRTPVGMGRETLITFRLVLAADVNRIDLQIARHVCGCADELDSDVPLTIVLRPDIEARDAHSKTLAYSGSETSYPAAVSPVADGFDFSHGKMPKCRMRLKGGRFHLEPFWSYAVPHSEEAVRGLGPSGDLFSPGWFEISLKGGDAVSLVAGVTGEFASGEPSDPKAALSTTKTSRVTVRDWLRSDPTGIFIADRDSLKTVIAGYPWFLDWGRDTLIVLRGLLAAGKIDEAIAILREFGRFEENGTLPNIILGDTAGNRDTTDAQLWFIVSFGDAFDVCGARGLADLSCGSRTLRDVILSIISNYISGTPNGIHVDSASGLVFSPPHFTWMDTNYPAATPRVGYPVEIQALWIASLAIVREKLGIITFADVEKRARASLTRLYTLSEGWLADNLRAANGECAERAVAEDTLRPNQLLAVTLGAIDANSETAKAIIRASERLLIPGGIRSLADKRVEIEQPVYGEHGLLNDPRRPYWGRYCGDEDTRRKPAYHNGTAWGWQFPLYCEACCKVYGESVTDAMSALLASVAEPLGFGCIGQIPEIYDGDAPHTQRGCLAQAWSVSEVVRVFKILHFK